MARFKGFYINLDKDKERKMALMKELSKTGKSALYEKFAAIEGNTAEASRKSLKAGEYGIWNTWIKLLGKIENDSDASYDYVHIIEDDTIVSNELFNLIEKLSCEESTIDILMTDMYTNISIYKAFEEQVAKILGQKDQWKVLTTNEYTGCAASCIIHRSKIRKIKDLLKEEYKSSHLIPIDNYLRKASKQGKLTICTTIPFLTTVQLSSISESTIQERQKYEATITKTQIYNTYLRRRLSIFRKTTDIREIVNIAKEILMEDSQKIDRFTAEIIKSANRFLEEEGALRYRVDKRLQSEDNPQANNKN